MSSHSTKQALNRLVTVLPTQAFIFPTFQTLPYVSKYCWSHREFARNKHFTYLWHFFL